MVKVDFSFEIFWTFFYYCRAKGQHWTGAQHVSKNTARGATNVPSSGLRHNTHDHNFDRNKNHDDYRLLIITREDDRSGKEAKVNFGLWQQQGAQETTQEQAETTQEEETTQEQ